MKVSRKKHYKWLNRDFYFFRKLHHAMDRHPHMFTFEYLAILLKDVP